MESSRLTPKRIFWTLTAAAFLWAVIGGHAAGPTSPELPPSFMVSVQAVGGAPVSIILIPVEFIFSGMQGMGTWAVQRMSARHDENESVDSLHEKIGQLQ